MERERARFLVCAARGEGVRAHQHGVVQRLAVVGVAGLRLKLVGVHRAPATVDVGSVRGRTKDRGAVLAEGGRWVHLTTTFDALPFENLRRGRRLQILGFTFGRGGGKSLRNNADDYA